MVNCIHTVGDILPSEEEYMTPHEAGFVEPEVDTLYIVLRRGTIRRPLNMLQDMVTEAKMHQGITPTDDLYTWINFRSMIEAVYGCVLQTFLDAHPGNVPAALDAWLSDYFAAHNYPTNTLDGWEGSGYSCPVGEPMSGLLPPSE